MVEMVETITPALSRFPATVFNHADVRLEIRPGDSHFRPGFRRSEW